MAGECVLIVEDHPLARFGAAAILEEAGFSVRTARGALDGLEQASAQQFDVALIDLDLPDRPGLWLIRTLASTYPTLAVAALTASVDEHRVVAVLDAGARGYISKQIELADLPRKVATLASGEEAFDDLTASRLIRTLRGSPARPGRLTPREVEVLQLLATGSDTATMAKQMFLSPNSVKDHVRSIYRKLEVHDRAAAVAEGFRLGLLS